MASVTVSKEVDLNIDCVQCECGEELSFKVTSDSYGDIQIEVDSHRCEVG